MKSYTDIEQSKKLAEILPTESADMARCGSKNVIMTDYMSAKKKFSVCGELTITPCWSLAALLELIPNYVINKADDKIYANLYYGFKSSHDNLVDAAFEMILELHELKML